MSTENKYRIVFFILLTVSSLFFFDVIRIDMEDKSLKYPIYMSGQPADMPTIVDKLETVQHAVCSSTNEGQEVVRKHALVVLRKKADELGGNGVIEVTTDYGPHPDLSENCAYGVFVRGLAVAFAD
ncbi:MAG: hypothetical protein COB26_08040 [Piscirickettsiaceae bacterium]|nr:MAG: hypothetical protein COB26_08040 [Piscirickettsiaceae bacterium]